MDKKVEPIVKDWLTRISELKNSPKGVSIIVLVLVAILALLYLVYSLLFLGKVYPNVFVGNQKYSGLPTEEIESRLKTAVEATLAQPLTVTFDDKSYTISAKEANWEADVAATAAAVTSVGRAKPWYKGLGEQLLAPFHKTNLTISADYDESYLATTVASIAESVDSPAVNATAAYDGEKLVVTYEKPGEGIDQKAVVQEILNRWSSGSSQPIQLVRTTQLPTVIVANEEALRSSAGELANRNLTLRWDEQEKKLTKTEIRQLIDFVGQRPPGTLDRREHLSAVFTENKTKVFLQDLAGEQINKPAKEPKLGIKDGALAILESSAEGRVVDTDASAKAIVEALTHNSTDAVTLSFKVEQPQISEANLSSLGIKEIIGRGETSFAGSPQNRRVNIVNGVRLLQSALVKPGDEFSTVKTLGAVDGTTGFLPELVIKDNRTTPEFGGGLCQVSTTLFRSVLNAGLKVTERQNHSYRVSYYEPPVGLDATIYLPKPDFKFLNDTNNYILVQGQVVGNKVIFELWGTKDGRVATVTDPVISNVLPPPPEVRVETDTLFRGEEKQIEKPHEGATTVAYYTVTKDGKVINKQTIRSVYKPWASRILVGTKEPPAPAPEAAPAQ